MSNNIDRDFNSISKQLQGRGVNVWDGDSLSHEYDKAFKTTLRLERKLAKHRGPLMEPGRTIFTNKSSHRSTLHYLKLARERGDAKEAKKLWAKAKREARKRMDTRAAIKHSEETRKMIGDARRAFYNRRGR